MMIMFDISISITHTHTHTHIHKAFREMKSIFEMYISSLFLAQSFQSSWNSVRELSKGLLLC